ncbi:hypothetical protein [Streptomyces platensis]
MPRPTALAFSIPLYAASPCPVPSLAHLQFYARSTASGASRATLSENC